MLDYAFEIEYFDQHLGKMLKLLEERNLMENTLIVVTSDNGMPFPRVKGNAYEYSNHLPLTMMWKGGIKNPGRTVEGYVSFTDFAPTFLDAAGITPEAGGMEPVEGQSLLNLLQDPQASSHRNFMVIGKERHDLGRPNDWGYPIRGIVRDNMLYLRNFEPDRWPAGNPETGYMNTDGSPTKTFILNERRREGSSYYWDLNFGKSPEEELYNIQEDPACVENLAGRTEYQEMKTLLEKMLTDELRAEGDPRVFGNGEIFDKYPYSDERQRGFYNRVKDGEDIKAGWIEETDIESEPL